MRIFNNESMWDAENQKWYDTYSINGKIVDEEIYHEQLEVEMLVADDEMELEDESYLCKCCSCDNDDCDESEDYIDNDLVIQCDCPDCVEQRRLDQCNCKECDCKDGSACDGCCREVEDNECDCLECREEKFITMAHDFIMNSGGCPDCILECLIDFSDDMKNIGWESHKDYIAECNEDS